MPAGSEQSILIDGHVHIYDCFDVSALLDAAYNNFRKHSLDQPFTGVLMLTETAGDDWFSRTFNDVLNENHDDVRHGQWQCSVLDDDECTLRLTMDGCTDELLVISGRQIATAERMEVLALGTRRRFSDGMSLGETIGASLDDGATTVIPWAVGKWLGGRGKQLDSFLASNKAGDILLGDNGGRPSFWRNLRHFDTAKGMGIRIFPGTDPLPLESEVYRVGSYGVKTRIQLDALRPSTSLVKHFSLNGITWTTYGRLERPWTFFRNQYYLKRLIRL